MTEEKIEIQNENEKPREKYFYLDKKETCRFLTTLGASFLGALLALYVFSALHKPPMPPMGFRMMKHRPCPMKFMDREFRHNEGFKIHREFKGPHGQRHVEMNWEFSTPQFPQDKMVPPQNAKFDRKAPIPNTINPEKK